MFREHPLRDELAAELHARPHGEITAPAEISHVAVHTGEGRAERDFAHLKELCSHFKVAPPAADATLFAADMGPFKLKWERHTEFSAYTFIAERPFKRPFKKPALDEVPEDWLATLPGEVISALHIALDARDTLENGNDEVAAAFDNNPLAGGQLIDGKARWWTDFRIHADRFSRFLVHCNALRADPAARLVQRIIEMETYRLMAMLALPIARAARPRVSAAESELAEILGKLGSDTDEGGDDRALLADLTRLAGEAESISGLIAYRFNATRAYQQIVRQRVQALRETRVSGLQPAGMFLLTRFEPAMESCDNLARRLEGLSARIARAGNLLRTRVDVALEEQNRDLLRSMDRRARLQLRLQQTVEGLSVAAISYYVISLVIYLARGAKSLGLAVDPYLAGTAAFPLVGGGVWWGVRRVRHKLTKSDDGSS